MMLTAALFLLFVSASFGQTSLPFHAETLKTKIKADEKVRSVVFSAERATPKMIEFDLEKGNLYPAAELPAVLNNVLELRSGTDELAAAKTTQTNHGIRYERFEQKFKNVPVEHGSYNAVITAEDKIAALTGEYYNLPAELNTVPTLDRDAALAVAEDYIGAEEYVYERILNMMDGVMSPTYAAHLYEQYEEALPGGELVIVDDYETEATDLDLAWKFNIYGDRPLSRQWVYVNAHTGTIMLKDLIIKHASEATTVQTRYAGLQPIMVNFYTGITDPNSGAALKDSRTGAPVVPATHTGFYILEDDTRGDGLETYDLNGVGGAPISIPAAYSQASVFTDNDLDFTLAEHKRGGANEAENDDIAWDAHWGTQVVYDYWKNVHNRNSYDDNDIKILSFVHSGIGYDNAFWNGTAMTYGDGSYNSATGSGSFAPLTSLDVCGHEVGHAICSHTSDLVYAKESGAMNEGFSDIWGAAIEDFAFRTIDPNLANIMAPYGIGEQIDERDGGIQYPAAGWRALRYMDEPNLAGDPDTYGGTHWQNPDCDPSLANDQCGVHTNSGVLNKWFYLLTNGESASNDNGDFYSVAGVGFVTSEQVAYGTELILTPNATFAEARAASIMVARTSSLPGSGVCGSLETAVTNAWYGVGVGPEFACNVAAGFTLAESFVGELNTASDDCESFKTIEVEAAVNASGTVTTAGTATPGVDYEITNPSFSAGAGFAVHNFSINIFDDAEIEGTETIILNIGANSHTITVNDNDVVPSIGDGSPTSLIDEPLTAAAFPADWTVDALDPGPNSWFSNTTNGAQIGIIAAGGTTPTYEGNTSDPVDVVLSTGLIDARGLGILHLTFDYVVGGEQDAFVGTGTDANGDGVPDPQEALYDFGNVAYSFDGDTWIDFTDTEFSKFAAVTGSVDMGTLDKDMPAYLAGNQFYLGFRWRNDPLAAGSYSFSVSNVSVTAATVAVADEATLIEDKLAGNNDIYFADASGAVIARVQNTSAHDYGCTTAEVTAAGTGKVDYPNGDTRMQKTFEITPTTPNANGTYDVTLYFTEAELAGYENATGMNRSSMVMLKTEGDIDDATSENSVINEQVTYAAHTGGGSFTASFTNGFSAFVMGNISAAALPVELIAFNAEAQENAIALTWETATEIDNEGFEIQRRAENENTFTTIAFVKGENAANGANYSALDRDVTAGTTYYYRLNQLDFDGKWALSDVRSATVKGDAATVTITPTLVRNTTVVSVSGAGNEQPLTVRVFNLAGQEVQTLTTTGAAVTLDLGGQTAGVYLVRVQTGNMQTTQRIVKQ